ncbi:unnamed protein product [Adineta ricciae]|uniref:Uncharacterized protein n=1 Tax=Adineta ricciae TaxID=249248 RepID=A0A814CZ92_ADIRI|nr:unnamed protein product [Adineta ricciae]
MNYRKKYHERNNDTDDDDGDESCKLVSLETTNHHVEGEGKQQQQGTSISILRSILRKRSEKNMSMDSYSHVQQASIKGEQNVNNDDERDSDYTGDENDDESNGRSKTLEEESKNNEQRQRHHEHCNNYSRHQQKDQFFRTSPSLSLDFPLETTASTETGTIEIELAPTSSSKTFYENNRACLSHTSCVTLVNDSPILKCKSSSASQIGGLGIQQRSSVTYINMKEDFSSTMPITTTTTSSTTALNNEFRPVYVSPLKYRPLVGLSANDSRLLLEKRVSLLGKPLVFHPIQKRSPNYRRIQLRIYNFLERPHGYKAVIYHTFVFLTVFLCLFLSVVVTMPEYESIASTFLLQTEILVVIWLTIELGLRVWSAGCRSRYQTLMGRLRFMKKPFCALDFTVIVATVVTLSLNSRGGNGVFAASALRGLRFFQILRMLRMDRRGGTWKLLGSVVYAHRQELITTIYIGFLVLIFSSFIMFLVEKDSFVEPDRTLITNGTNLMATSSITNLIDTDRHKFETFADALWWGIITLCTVGYGDKVPSSYMGKLIAAICSFIGISFFALPAGILGSGFALKVQQQQRQKHYKRRKIPAVLLIQNLWRVYAADEKSLSKATWKVHVRPPRHQSKSSSTLHPNPHQLSARVRNNPSFLNRVSFRRRTTRETSSTNLNPEKSSSNLNLKPLPNSTVAAMRSCIDTLTETANMAPTANLSALHEGSSSDNEEDHLYYASDVKSLTETHRNAIRFVRKIKYYVARRKFREALRPYDVTDVIEQYSTGNVDMLARMKYLQARLDKVLGTSKSLDSYESGPSLASRICKIETQVDNLDVKIEKLCQLATSILERPNSQPTSNSSSITQTVVNRIRTGNRYHVYYHRRRRRTPLPQTQILTQVPSEPHPHPAPHPPRFYPVVTPPTRASSGTNLSETLTSSPTTTGEHTRESLVSLYWLFQDNLNSSRNALV